MLHFEDILQNDLSSHLPDLKALWAGAASVMALATYFTFQKMTNHDMTKVAFQGIKRDSLADFVMSDATLIGQAGIHHRNHVDNMSMEAKARQQKTALRRGHPVPQEEARKRRQKPNMSGNCVVIMSNHTLDN